jgi:D-xylose transport system permease protein
MATGMVFVIVTRHIDLSVGSLLATCSAIMAMMQTWILPHMLGLGLGHPLIAPIAILVGLVGHADRRLPGLARRLHAIPAFIVTLGGLLVWRNVAGTRRAARRSGPLDETFQLFGGTNGTLGETGPGSSALIAVAAALWGPMPPTPQQAQARLPGEADLGGIRPGRDCTAAILGFIATLNAYEIPARTACARCSRRAAK